MIVTVATGRFDASVAAEVSPGAEDSEWLGSGDAVVEGVGEKKTMDVEGGSGVPSGFVKLARSDMTSRFAQEGIFVSSGTEFGYLCGHLRQKATSSLSE